MIWRSVVLFFLVCRCTLLQVAAEDAATNLALVRSGFAQRIASIESIDVHYEIRGVELSTETESPPSEFLHWIEGPTGCRFLRNQNNMPLEPGHEYRNPLDAATKNDVTTLLRQDAVSDNVWEFQATLTHDPIPASFSDFRGRTLQVLEQEPLLTLSEGLQTESRIENCEFLEGQYAVTFFIDDDTTATMLFDPKRNFLVTRRDIVYEHNEAFAGLSDEVVEATEAVPGVWIPTVVDSKQFRREKGETISPTHASRFRVTKLAVNEPLPDDIFDVKMPPGTEVWNEVTGKLYIWGDGKPASDKVPLPELQTPKSFQLGEELPAASGRSWLVVANFVLVAVAAIFLFFRRRNA